MLMLHLLVGGFACDVPVFWVCIYYAMIIWRSCSVSAGPAGAAVGFEAAATTYLSIWCTQSVWSVVHSTLSRVSSVVL
jgi:hypothetical protein